MGFKFTKSGETSCTFSATVDGDDSEQFMQCVQKALKGLLLDITIDLAQSPKSFGAVLSDVLKLQKVLAQHQKGVTVTGLRGASSSDFVKRLQSMGIHIFESETQMTLHGVIHPVIQLSGAQPAGVLPSAAEIAIHFTELRKAFADALMMKARLQKEKRSFEERTHALQNQKKDEGSSYNQTQIERLAELESRVASIKNEREEIQRLVESDRKKLSELEIELKATLDQATESFKKEKDVIDKQLGESARRHDKVRAEYKKKSEARREKLGHG